MILVKNKKRERAFDEQDEDEDEKGGWCLHGHKHACVYVEDIYMWSRRTCRSEDAKREKRRGPAL